MGRLKYCASSSLSNKAEQWLTRQITSFHRTDGRTFAFTELLSEPKTVEFFNTHLTEAIDPYKKFKNMYFVDRTTEEFKGQGKKLFS